VCATSTPMIAGFLYSSYGLVNGVRFGFTIVFSVYVFAGFLRSRIKETIDDAEQPSFAEIKESFKGLGMIKEGSEAWRQIPRNAITLFGLQLIFYMSFMSYMGVSKFFITQDLKINPIYFSTLYSVVGISNIIFTLPVGKIIDKYGKKVPMISSLVIFVAALLLVYFGSLTILYIALPLSGLGSIMFMTASSALWADIIPQEFRGRIIGTKAFMEIIAASIGLVTGGFIYDYISHRLPLQIVITSCGVLFFAFLFYVKEPEKVTPGI